ncbi:hypothetical protein GCM10010361_68360 [Streptomyces olivaceiscleroticus]|uniref:Uncharacterized protein n=1 Tax=Streptomyces olivaceiscleroticus TaxID=68245 RepID=A0ABP3L6V0_9ACTN
MLAGTGAPAGMRGVFRPRAGRPAAGKSDLNSGRHPFREMGPCRSRRVHEEFPAGGRARKRHRKGGKEEKEEKEDEMEEAEREGGQGEEREGEENSRKVYTA